MGEDITRLRKSIKYKKSRRDRLSSEKAIFKAKSDELQEKLLREGNHITLSEMRRLQEERTRLYEEGKSLMNEFRDQLDLVPFTIAGAVLTDIQKQLNAEVKQHQSFTDKNLLENKIETIIQSLTNDTDYRPLDMDTEAKDHHLVKLRDLLREHFVAVEEDSDRMPVAILHDFTNEQKRNFDTMLSKLSTTYKDRLQSTSR